MIQVKYFWIVWGLWVVTTFSWIMMPETTPETIYIHDTIIDTVDNCALIQAEQDSLHASWDRWENE